MSKSHEKIELDSFHRYSLSRHVHCMLDTPFK